MGFLDQLKQQAQEIRAEEATQAGQLAHNAALVDRELRRIFQYLCELAKQLNVIRPPTSRSFDLPRVGRLSGLRLGDFYTDYRLTNDFGSEQFASTYVRFVQASETPLKTTIEFEENVRNLERMLDAFNITYRADYVKHGNRLLKHADFVVEPMVRSKVMFAGLHTSGEIVITMTNVDAFGSFKMTRPATRVDSVFLDEMSRYLLGHNSALFNRAPVPR